MENFPQKLAQDTLEKIIAFLIFKKIISSKHKITIVIKNISEKEIKKLNQKYRKKNEPTDILSFGYQFDKNILEGDLLLCWGIIRKNAKEDNIKSEQELKKNLIHGCLHLTGLEHSKEMFELQADFLKI